jgi:hypothetical protein
MAGWGLPILTAGSENTFGVLLQPAWNSDISECL